MLASCWIKPILSTEHRIESQTRRNTRLQRIENNILPEYPSTLFENFTRPSGVDIESRRISRTTEYKWVRLQREEQRKRERVQGTNSEPNLIIIPLPLVSFHPRSLESKSYIYTLEPPRRRHEKNLIDHVCIKWNCRRWKDYFDSIYPFSQPIARFSGLSFRELSNCINYDILVTIWTYQPTFSQCI